MLCNSLSLLLLWFPSLCTSLPTLRLLFEILSVLLERLQSISWICHTANTVIQCRLHHGMQLDQIICKNHTVCFISSADHTIWSYMKYLLFSTNPGTDWHRVVQEDIKCKNAKCQNDNAYCTNWTLILALILTLISELQTYRVSTVGDNYPLPSPFPSHFLTPVFSSPCSNCPTSDPFMGSFGLGTVKFVFS